jgi:hypothetical protein
MAFCALLKKKGGEGRKTTEMPAASWLIPTISTAPVHRVQRDWYRRLRGRSGTSYGLLALIPNPARL